jgi:CheY-like chemotaxis protein
MSSAVPQKPFEVLVVEDQGAPAKNIERRLNDEGCNCTLLLHEHLHLFVQEFEARYPAGSKPESVQSFDGTVLDVIFHAHQGKKQLHGGFELYQYWQQRGILPHLGVVLIVTESLEAAELFRHQDVKVSKKNNSRILGTNLGAFVRHMGYKRLHGLADHLKKLSSVAIDAQASQDGYLYGSIGAAEIAKALRSRGYPIEADMVRLEEPIKEKGVYDVMVKFGHDPELGRDIEARVEVSVTPARK